LIKLSTALFLGAVLFSIAGCSNKASAKKKQKIEHSENEESNYSKLAGEFEDIDLGQLHIFSSYDFNSTNFKFKGNLLNEARIFLPDEFMDEYNINKEFAACYEFKIDETHVGLIIRCPGEYSSTAIQLAIFDLDLDRVTKTIYLSDVFGDAGEVMNYSSYLFKDENEDVQLLKYSFNSYQEIDDTVYSENHSYGLFDISYKWMDTISLDSSYLATKYPKMIKQLTSL
jgi:hypothetical protein